MGVARPQELKHWKQKYEVARTFLELERGQRLPGEQGPDRYHPDTTTRAIEDLRDPPDEKPKLRRYEITVHGVTWSEDGAGFRERGRKKDLLVLQDECSRFKIDWRLAAPRDDCSCSLRVNGRGSSRR
jgi:hypothetical protein